MRRIAAGAQHAVQFAAGDDVETGAGLGQQREYGQRGVGFDGVADGVREIAEGTAHKRDSWSRMALAE